jgi:hypothetical protein
MIHILKQNFDKLKNKLGPYVLYSPLGPLLDLIQTKIGIEPAISAIGKLYLYFFHCLHYFVLV